MPATTAHADPPDDRMAPPAAPWARAGLVLAALAIVVLALWPAQAGPVARITLALLGLGGLAAGWLMPRRTAPAGCAIDAKALAALQRSDAQLRHAEQVARLGSFDWNPVTGELHWSDEHYRLWGLEPGSVTADYQVFRAAVHPDDVATLEAQLQSALQGALVYECTHRVVWPDGSVHDVLARGEVYFDASGRAARMVGTVQDVSERVRVKAALAASVENLRRTLNATGDAIFASEARAPNQPVLFVNDQMLQMWGIPPEAAETLTPATIMRHAAALFVDPEAQARRVTEIIASGEPSEERVELNDGRVLMRRCVPTRDAGRSVRVWGFRDITVEERALRALRVSEAEQRALLDAFPGYIACLDAQLRYTYVNERLARLAGTTPEAMHGRPLGEVEGTPRSPATDEPLYRALAGEKVVVEHWLPANAHREDTILLVTLTPGPDPRTGERVCYAFGTDISELKRAEFALLAAKREAERANRAKSQFLSSMSHELRTPMNSVLGFGQLLEADPQLDARGRAYVGEILRGGRHLLNLINDLLDLARIEADRLALSLEPVDADELLDECLSLVQPLADKRSVALAPHAGTPLGHVMADRTRLRQVLINLLGNAIKYNRDGGRVWVHGSLHEGRLRIAVCDTGRGFDAAAAERLFKPFERLQADTTSVEGAGIGLALCRSLVELMHGSIGVDSVPGQGSAFWFELAAVQAGAAVPGNAAPPAHPTPAPTGAGRPARTVLYIEDNPVNIVLMEAMIERLPGVRLVTASHPAAGLRSAREIRPDLIMLDIQMPDMDGYEVLDRLHADAATAAIPVIAVSANAMSQDVERGRNAGFTAYLTKPVDLPVLLSAVDAALAGAGHP